MKGILFQLLGDGIEELYYTENFAITDDNVKEYYQQWEKLDSDDFEEWMDQKHPEAGLIRVFVTEVNV